MYIRSKFNIDSLLLRLLLRFIARDAPGLVSASPTDALGRETASPGGALGWGAASYKTRLADALGRCIQTDALGLQHR